MNCETCCDWFMCRGRNCMVVGNFKKSNGPFKIIDKNKNGIRRERVIHKKVFEKRREINEIKVKTVGDERFQTL